MKESAIRRRSQILAKFAKRVQCATRLVALSDYDTAGTGVGAVPDSENAAPERDIVETLMKQIRGKISRKKRHKYLSELHRVAGADGLRRLLEDTCDKKDVPRGIISVVGSSKDLESARVVMSLYSKLSHEDVRKAAVEMLAVYPALEGVETLILEELRAGVLGLELSAINATWTKNGGKPLVLEETPSSPEGPVIGDGAGATELSDEVAVVRESSIKEIGAAADVGASIAVPGSPIGDIEPVEVLAKTAATPGSPPVESGDRGAVGEVDASPGTAASGTGPGEVHDDVAAMEAGIEIGGTVNIAKPGPPPTWDELVQRWKRGATEREREDAAAALLRFDDDLVSERFLDLPGPLRDNVIIPLLLADLRTGVVYRGLARRLDGIWDDDAHQLVRFYEAISFIAKYWRELNGFESKLVGRLSAIGEYVLSGVPGEPSRSERELVSKIVEFMGKSGALARVAAEPAALERFPPWVAEKIVVKLMQEMDSATALTWMAERLESARSRSALRQSFRVLVAAAGRFAREQIMSLYRRLQPDTAQDFLEVQVDRIYGLQDSLQQHSRHLEAQEDRLLRAWAEKIAEPLKNVELLLATSFVESEPRSTLLHHWDQLRSGLSDVGLFPVETVMGPVEYNPSLHEWLPPQRRADGGSDARPARFVYMLTRGIWLDADESPFQRAIVSNENPMGDDEP